MDSTSTEPQSDVPVPFRDSHWKMRWIVVGLAVLFLWRATALIDQEWLLQMPWWIVAIAIGILPQCFLLLFPIVTRCPRGRLYIPTLTRCLIEVGIAVPLVIGAVLASSAIYYLLSHFLTGKTIMEDFNKSLAESRQPIITYLLLVFASTFAPVAEELFFRGFLFNAFRVRMPWTLALVTQSLIFGFCHFFGALHSAGAFLAGIFLTLIYEWRKTLITPMLVHAGVNAIPAIGVAMMTVAYANGPVLGVASEPNDTACVIRYVFPDSAAEQAGLQVGDVITAFGGEAIQDALQLIEAVRRHQTGDTVAVSINRAGSSMEVTVVLQRRGDQRTD